MRNGDQFSQLVGQLMRQLNLLNRDQKVCYGVTLPQCYTIETVARKGRLTMNELSRLMGVSLSTMTRVVDVLVRDDVLQRVPNPSDRRKVCIRLTEKGQELARKLKACTASYTLEILEKIPREKQEQVIESMELLSEAIESVKQKCCG